MSDLVWSRLAGWTRRVVANTGWVLFCWGAGGYQGFVCDHASMDPLPCDLWWQEQDAKKEVSNA